jgi:hypothetical protein
MCGSKPGAEQQSGGYNNYPRRPVGLYTQSGELMNSENHMQRLATPAVWEDEAAQNVENSVPVNPSLGDYAALFATMMGPRIPYEDASNGAKRALSRGQVKEPLDENMQRVWSR